MKRQHLFLVVAAVIALAPEPLAQAQAARPPLAGVYRAIADTVVLPGGLRNSGSPREIRLTAGGAERAKTSDLTEDAYKLCLPVGAFRMMAADGAKIELVPTVDRIVMLFEDISHGYLRTFYLARGHRDGTAPTWQGDSVARWEGRTLVVDTIGISDRVWLNQLGAQHSAALRLTERITPIDGGRFLEYRMTAEDPEVLVAPYSYTRYYEKLDAEIEEDTCEVRE